MAVSSHLDVAGVRPSAVRYQVVIVTTFVSFIMYLDRACLSEIVKPGYSFSTELGLNEQHGGLILGAFFLAYALMQVPAGWFSDRFGARSMMSFYVVLWSFATVQTGLAGGFVSLLVARLACGVAQAGAYPTSGGLLSRWVPFASRGTASAIVATGGRIGLASAPWLTAEAIIRLGGWRETLWFYGSVGIAIAGWFWFVFRERPEGHPRVNEAECQLIARDLPAGMHRAQGRAGAIPWGAILRSRSLWCLSISLFCTNIGWAFLITWLPTYMTIGKGLSDEEGAALSSLALMGGMVGLMVGGWVTDVATRRFGVCWGRRGPLAISRLLAMAAYLVLIEFDSPWVATAAFAVVGFATDVGVGATWALAQDVGGRHVGSVLGWCNMWGNLGASVISVVLPLAVDLKSSLTNWNHAFLLLAAAFLISGFTALFVDASQAVTPSEPPECPTV